MKEIASTLLVIALIVVGIFVGADALSRRGCAAETEDIGYAHRYSFMAGCQIEIEDGRWIPLDAYYYQERS